MSSHSIQFDALVCALKLADPSERKKASQRELSRILKALESPRPRTKPGPELSRNRVIEATQVVLRDLFPTIDGVAWTLLLERTPEEVNALPLDVWKRTWEGRTVFERDGQEQFEAWVTRQKNKHKKWKELHQLKELCQFVEQRLSLTFRKGRKHSRGGKFRQYVREAQEKFLFSWHGLTWESIPPHLRRQYRDPHDLKRRQMEYQFTVYGTS